MEPACFTLYEPKNCELAMVKLSRADFERYCEAVVRADACLFALSVSPHLGQLDVSATVSRTAACEGAAIDAEL